MIRIAIVFLATAAALITWNTSVFLAVSEGWFKSPITKTDAAVDFAEAATAIVETQHTGNFVMALIEEGQVAETYAMSSGRPVDGTSVFQVASLGKWLTAWGVMALVEDGTIDLDEPISTYLGSWQLPESEFDTSGVTARRLLSHTAGLVDDLGYDGFADPGDVQSIEDSLDRALDASPGKDGIVKLGAEPGSGWRYSGGGFTVLQLLIEERSGQPFADFMSERVFEPLGMSRTTFDHDDALRLGLAQNFDLDGNTEPFRFYTALAATSLFTTADDLATFIRSQSPTGSQDVLSEVTLDLMLTPYASQMGADIWGLGPMLYAPNNQGGHIIGHDGNNGPAINTVARHDPATGDGIVILSTGSDMLATELAGEWVFWKTRNIDSLMFLMSSEAMLLWMLIGSFVIITSAIGLIILRRQKILIQKTR